jgi:Tfp pilus assembly protein PilV
MERFTNNMKNQTKDYRLQTTASSNSAVDQRGQSLLELTVLVGLALIVVSGLVIVTVNGLKNSQYSQNQTQATKLAQEGMDEVKSIEDRNCAVSTGSLYLWYNSKNGGADLVWSNSWSTPQSFQITNYSTCSETLAGLTTAAHDIDPNTAGGIFTRDVTIEDYSSSSNCNPSSSCKVVKVQVTWSDYSGNHNSQLSTLLSEQQ